MADDSPKPGDNPLLAGVEGAVRGIVPFGMGDALVQGTLGGFSPENWEKIASGERQRKEVSPGAAIAGELSGNLAGLLIPGSQAKVVGAVEDFASKAVGGGLAGKLAAGAAGGGLYGLGSAINEDTLGEPSTAAEKLAIISGSGLIGAGVNAITHGAFKASESALTKVAGSSSLREWLDSLANKLYEKQMASASVENANNLTREEVHSIFQNNKGLFSPLDTHASVAKKAAQAREWAGQEMGAALAPVADKPFDISKFQQRIEKNLLAELRRDPGAKSDVKYIEGYLNSLKGQDRLDEMALIQKRLENLQGTTERQARLAELKDIAAQASRGEAHAGQLEGLQSRIESLTESQGKAQELEALHNELKIAQQAEAAGDEAGVKGAKVAALEGRIGSLQREVARSGEIDVLRAKVQELEHPKMKLPQAQRAQSVKALTRQIADLEDQRIVERYNGLQKQLESLAVEAPEGPSKVEAIKEQIRALKGSGASEKLASLQDQLAELAAQGPGGPSKAEEVRQWMAVLRAEPRLQKMDDLASRLAELQGAAPRPYTLGEAHNLQSKIQSQIGQAEVPASKRIRSEFRTQLRDELIDQMHAASPGSGRQYTDASNSFRQLSALQEMADTMAKRSGRNSSLAMRDMFFGGVLGHLGVIPGLAGAAVSHEVRERGGYVMAAAARKMAESFPGIAGSFKGKIDAMLESGLGGAYRNTLAELSAKGADALLGGHVVLAQTDPNYLPTLGLEHETPEASQQYAGKAAGLSFLQEQLNGLNSELDNQADRFAGKAQGRPPSMPISPKMSEKDFAETYARLQHIATVPQVVDTSKMAGVAPATAALYQQQLVKAAQFLLDKAPKDPNAGLLPAFQKPWKPSPSDLATWTKYAEGVTQPLKVVTAVSNGKLPAPEAVEALKTVYPKTFEDLRNRMMERVASLKDPMSYGKKQALAALLGREVLGEDPRVATFIQTTHAAARGPGGGGNMPKTDGRQRVSQAENMATQAQRIQTRGAQ